MLKFVVHSMDSCRSETTQIPMSVALSHIPYLWQLIDCADFTEAGRRLNLCFKNHLLAQTNVWKRVTKARPKKLLAPPI